jgi:PAS domain S-box-containing protein
MPKKQKLASGDDGYSVGCVQERLSSRRRPQSADAPQRPDAEAALELAAKKYATILATVQSGFGLFDLEGRLLEVNDAYCRMSGYRRDELLQMHICDLDANDSKEDVLAHIQRARERGHDEFESRHRRKDNSIFDVDICATYLDIEGGRLVVFARDISDRKRAEEALRESEERLRTTLVASGVGWWRLDLISGEAQADARGRELFGLAPDDPVSLPIALALMHPEDRERIEKQFAQVGQAGREGEEEFRVLLPNGGTRRLLGRGRLFHADGKPSHFMGVVVDVTERQQVEKALRQAHEDLQVRSEELALANDELRVQSLQLQESEQRLRMALEGGRMGRWEWDLQTDSMFWCRRTYELLGLETFCKPSIEAFLECIHPDDRRAAKRLMVEALNDRPDLEIEVRVLRHRQEPRGEISWLACRAQVICDAQGQATRIIGVMYDVTARKQMEAELRRANERLEEEVQAQTEALQDTVDRLQEEAARRALAEDKLRKRSQTLEQRAQQLQKLTLELSQAEDRERRRLAEILHDDLQQVLAAAKFHLGFLDGGAQSPAQAQEIVGQIKQMLKDAIEKSRSLSHELAPAVLYQSNLGDTFEWLAGQVQKKHGLAIHVEVRGDVDSRSEAHRAFLYRAGQELLFNMVKHAKVAEAKLRLQRMRGQLWLTVSDNGRGFDPNTLGQTAGFGLLSIRERVELLGGRMKIRSAAGRGTTILIGICDERAEEKGTREEGKKARSQESLVVPGSGVPTVLPAVLSGSQRRRVLLVDDHKVMRQGLAAMLCRELDLEIAGQATNGREAIDLACMLKPDVIVMDVAMPVMPGDEATRQIKRRLPQVRVVGLSMFEEPGVAQRMREAGADAYLSKTGPSEDLLAAIRG